MDTIKRLKWPLIVGAVALACWLCSSAGTEFMLHQYSKAQPGENADRDKRDEAGLSRLAGFLIFTFQYEKAAAVMEESISRYSMSGANYWFNMYRRVKCYEKMNDPRTAASLLDQVIGANASQFDERVPTNEALELRAEKMKELNGLS